jgi:hypothetical protein
MVVDPLEEIFIAREPTPEERGAERSSRRSVAPSIGSSSGIRRAPLEPA